MHVEVTQEVLTRAATTVPDAVRRVLEVLERGGFSAVVVGGAVRDLVLGREPEDFDVATSALPDEVMRLFPNTVPTGIKHGTVTVLEASDGGHRIPVEVTTYRVEGAYRDGRRPSEVSFVSDLREDLARRDFTINALALHLWPTVHLSDPFGGLRDLEKGVLRTVGEPDIRFGEDGLRAVRAARFAAQLQLRAADGLEEAMGRTVPIVRKVAAERFWQELRKLMEKAPRPSTGLRMLVRTGLMDVIAPGAPLDDNSLERPDRLPLGVLLPRVAGWLWRSGRDGARATLEALKTSRAIQDDVAALCGTPPPHELTQLTDAGLRQLVRAVARRRVDALFALWDAEGAAALSERVRDVLARGYVETPAGLVLDGKALQQLTGAQGANLGRLLQSLLARVDEDPALNEPARLAQAARALGEGS